MLDRILSFIADKLNWSGFNYTWDVGTNNTSDTWIPVFNGNTIQHRVEQDWVVEKGNNYIRYNSGIQICWGSFNVNVTVTQVGSYYMGITPSISFSKPFSEQPVINVNIGSFGTGYFWGASRSHNAKNFTANAIKTQAGKGACWGTYVAIGRLK